ncbi:hypothetical protein PIB30_098957, partial [Stylosanthes scabra]|nr:hypothetical protein [Stylosanthes scabra]
VVSYDISVVAWEMGSGSTRACKRISYFHKELRRSNLRKLSSAMKHNLQIIIPFNRKTAIFHALRHNGNRNRIIYPDTLPTIQPKLPDNNALQLG